jgi:hypothetical protein
MARWNLIGTVSELVYLRPNQNIPPRSVCLSHRVKQTEEVMAQPQNSIHAHHGHAPAPFITSAIWLQIDLMVQPRWPPLLLSLSWAVVATPADDNAVISSKQAINAVAS